MAKDRIAANANRIDPYKSFKFRLRKAVVDSGRTIGRITRLPIDRLRKALGRSDKV